MKLHPTDLQFNNAGIMHPADDNALVTDEKIWDLTQNINVKGVWYGCKHAIIAMRQVSHRSSSGADSDSRTRRLIGRECLSVDTG